MSCCEEVSFEEGEALAAQFTAEAPEPRGPWSKVWFTETSSVGNVGLEKAMVRAVRQMLQVQERPLPPPPAPPPEAKGGLGCSVC